MLANNYYVSAERAELCVDAARSALRVERSLEPMDIALYIGIPFCPSRCAYCSFVSNSVEKSFSLVEPFVQALLREIDAAAALIGELGLRVITVYIGGGTPTSLPPELFDTLLQALRNSFDFSFLREYTVEAGRPDTITRQKLEMMVRAGARRVCVNPQSMSRDVLAAIGRRHTPEDVLDAVKLVRESGMSLNMDVIAGLPGDTPEGFRHTHDTVLDLRPENITVHTLSLKKGSRIMLEETTRPGGAEVAGMLEYASRRLRGNDYSPYYLYRQKFTSGGFENTGWRLPGQEGIYNICMMEELCSVISLGGGAVTKLVSPGGRIERIFNAKYPREYILQYDNLNSGKAEEKFRKIKEFYHAVSV
jgi:oxygen-independent coproporphyrinogen-3 oxidase